MKYEIKRGTTADWIAQGLDETLPLDLDLDNKVIIEIGTCNGDNAVRYVKKFNCRFIGYDPIPEFCEETKKRLAELNRGDVIIINMGVGAKSGEMEIGVEGLATGSFFPWNRRVVKVISVVEVFSEHNDVGLLTINCEGGEYEILETILDLEIQNKFENIMVQFHQMCPPWGGPVIPNAVLRREAIRDKLSKTHRLTFDYEFCWENWQRL